MINTIITLGLLVLASGLDDDSQVVSFDLVHNGKVVGVLEASKVSDGTRTVYQNHTTVKTQIIKEVKIEYETYVIYDAGVLSTAIVKTWVNGKLRSCNETYRVNNVYTFYKNGRTGKPIHKPVKFSSVMLLFQEPVGIEYAYSEETGEFININKTGSLSYAKKNANGNTNTYFYSNASLARIKVEGALFSYEMTLSRN